MIPLALKNNGELQSTNTRDYVAYINPPLVDSALFAYNRPLSSNRQHYHIGDCLEDNGRLLELPLFLITYACI